MYKSRIVKDAFGRFFLGTACLAAAVLYWPVAKILGVPIVDLDITIIGVNKKLGWH